MIEKRNSLALYLRDLMDGYMSWIPKLINFLALWLLDIIIKVGSGTGSINLGTRFTSLLNPFLIPCTIFLPWALRILDATQTLKPHTASVVKPLPSKRPKLSKRVSCNEMQFKGSLTLKPYEHQQH